MRKLIKILLFLLVPIISFGQVQAQQKNPSLQPIPFWQWSGTSSISPTSQLNILPYGNQLGNLGATGTRFNFGYFDTTITNHLGLGSLSYFNESGSVLRRFSGTTSNYYFQIGSNATTDYDITSTTDVGGVNAKVAMRTTGTITNGYGLTVKPVWLDDGTAKTFTTINGILIEEGEKNGTVLTPNAIGLYLNAQTLGTTNNTGIHLVAPTGSASGNNIGLYMTTPSNASTLNRQLYLVGSTGVSYIEGKMIFGVDKDPEASLQMNRYAAGEGIISQSAWMGSFYPLDSSYAAFAHKKFRNTASSYALVQNNDGLTIVGSVAGQGTGLAVGGSRYLVITGTNHNTLIKTTTEATSNALQVAGNVDLVNGVTPTNLYIWSKNATGTNDRYSQSGWGAGADSLKYSIAETHNGGSAQGNFNLTGFSSYNFDNNLLFSAAETYIMKTTSDGADNGATYVGGGGAISSTRGGYIQISGNEHASTGLVSIVAGNTGGNSIISFHTGAGVEKWRIGSTGIFQSADPGTSANSYYISMVADNTTTQQTGTIQVMYGADPYMRFAAPNDAGTATAIMDLKDQRVVIGSSVAGVDYDIYFQGETSQGSITHMEDEDRIDFDNDVDVVADLTAGTVQSDATVKATTMVGNVAQQTITLGASATTFAVTSNVITVTGDAGANTLATITGAVVGTYVFIFVDALVTITDNDTHAANSIDLAGTATNFTSADDKTLTVVYDGTSFYQISTSTN